MLGYGPNSIVRMGLTRLSPPVAVFGGNHVHRLKFDDGTSRRVQCYSSRKDDKGWGEIAEDAVNVAKSVVGKLVDTGKAAVEKVTKKSEEGRVSRQREEDDTDIFKAPGGSGIMGGLIGGVLNMAMKSVTKQIRESQKMTQAAYSQAADRVMSSRKVSDSLGEVTCQPPYSQSSATQSINGVVSKRTSLMFTAVGRGGTANVQADAVEGSTGIQELNVKVRLPNGKTVTLDDDDDGFGGGGRTIDAEWTNA
ncbi:hypothetical protein BSKO_01087 [Bryopsis sp. KO-2023]|nr:hypothetical protein BSKO_01087 [Bryopsis sp. KO-2023]